jgi:hypothetical protein
LSFADLKAFELLLAKGAPEAEVDHFLDGLNSHADESSALLLNHFSKNGGLVREQIPFLSNLYAKGSYIDRRPASRIAFIFFGSLLDSMGTAGVRSRLHRMNANCIYLHDDRFLNFGLGVRQCGADIRQTDAAVMQRVRDWGVDRIITVGSSAAAFTAIKRAFPLNAYACVTFSPFTTFADAHHQQDGRGKAIVDRCRTLAPDMLIDLVPLLAERDPALKLVCFYSKGLPRDAWHAERVQCVQDTFMMPLNLETHGLLGPVIGNGMFDFFMQPLVDGSSVEDSVALCKARYAPSDPPPQPTSTNAESVS